MIRECLTCKHAHKMMTSAPCKDCVGARTHYEIAYKCSLCKHMSSCDKGSSVFKDCIEVGSDLRKYFEKKEKEIPKGVIRNKL